MVRIWLLWLVPPIRYGRFLSAALIFATTASAFAWVGMFDPASGANFTTGVALFFSAILAYIVPAYHLIVERAQRGLDELAETPCLDGTTLAREKQKLTHRSRRWVLAVLVAGIGASLLHNTLLYAQDGQPLTSAREPLQFGSLLGGTLVWVTMTFAITGLIEIARQFNSLARNVALDLLHTAQLTPFGRVAVSSTLAIIGAQALFPLMWFGGDTSWLAAVPGLIATAVPMAFLFALPVWPIHRRIAGAKREELARIGDLLVAERGSRSAAPTRAELDQLAPLLSYRAEITALHEWPFDATVLTRLGFYLIIPPLTWVGAAFIEVVIEGFV